MMIHAVIGGVLWRRYHSELRVWRKPAETAKMLMGRRSLLPRHCRRRPHLDLLLAMQWPEPDLPGDCDAAKDYPSKQLKAKGPDLLPERRRGRSLAT